MGAHVAQKLVKLLIDADITVKGARVGVLGLTFKEDCNDLRNSKVPDIVKELRQFGIDPLVHDPLASAPEALHEYGLKLSPWRELSPLDAMVFAVSHRWYLDLGPERAPRHDPRRRCHGRREERPPAREHGARDPLLEPLALALARPPARPRGGERRPRPGTSRGVCRGFDRQSARWTESSLAPTVL